MGQMLGWEEGTLDELTSFDLPTFAFFCINLADTAYRAASSFSHGVAQKDS